MLQWISKWMSPFYLYFLGKWKWKSLSHAWLFTTPWTIYSPWNSPSQNTRVGSHSLLQGIFPTQGSTQVSHTAGGFFTSWATREALLGEYLTRSFYYMTNGNNLKWCLIIMLLISWWLHIWTLTGHIWINILWTYSQFLIYYLKFLYIYINNKLKC